MRVRSPPRCGSGSSAFFWRILAADGSAACQLTETTGANPYKPHGSQVVVLEVAGSNPVIHPNKNNDFAVIGGGSWSRQLVWGGTGVARNQDEPRAHDDLYLLPQAC